jgi:hypothetical protein
VVGANHVTMRSFRPPFFESPRQPLSERRFEKGGEIATQALGLFDFFRILPVEAIESFGRLAGSYSIRGALEGEILTQVRSLTLQMETSIKIHLVWILRIWEDGTYILVTSELWVIYSV